MTNAQKNPNSAKTQNLNNWDLGFTVLVGHWNLVIGI